MKHSQPLAIFKFVRIQNKNQSALVVADGGSRAQKPCTLRLRKIDREKIYQIPLSQTSVSSSTPDQQFFYEAALWDAYDRDMEIKIVNERITKSYEAYLQLISMITLFPENSEVIASAAKKIHRNIKKIVRTTPSAMGDSIRTEQDRVFHSQIPESLARKSDAERKFTRSYRQSKYPLNRNVTKQLLRADSLEFIRDEFRG